MTRNSLSYRLEEFQQNFDTMGAAWTRLEVSTIGWINVLVGIQQVWANIDPYYNRALADWLFSEKYLIPNYSLIIRSANYSEIN